VRACALPPHRPAYLTYEGEVSGGRGRVRRVDEGTCELLADDPGRVVLRLRGRRWSCRAEMVRDPAASADAGGRQRDWTFHLGKAD
jgi:hypothetical protein